MEQIYKIMVVFVMLFSSVSSSPVDTMPCMSKLIPCRPYLTATSTPPPSSCCVPLKAMLGSDDSTCLCAVFNNPGFLKSLNITQDDALALTKSCGANADVSICDKAAAEVPTASPSTPSNDTSSSPDLAEPSSGAATFGTGSGSRFVYFALSSLALSAISPFWLLN